MSILQFLRAAASAAVLLPVLAFAHGDEDHGSPPATQNKSSQPLAMPAGNETPIRLADGAVFFPKTSQNLLAVRTALVRSGEVSQTLELKGRVKPDPSAGGQVQAPQMGRLVANGNGLPALGERVRTGQVLAWLEPTIGSIERSGQQAQLAQLQSTYEIARRKVQRYEQLEGSIPQKEIDSARAEMQALQQQKEAISRGLIGRLPLVAPASGVISSVAAVAGQVVDAREVLFSVVDPQRLIVEAVAYDTGILGNIAEVSGITETGSPLKLKVLGAGLELREQALPVQLRIVAPAPPLAIGQPVKVFAQLREKKRGVAVPVNAVARSSSGDTVVWIHSAAERFEPRKVQVQNLDAATVVVTDGLQGGERVVVQGVAALSQVR